jgi:hydrogenase maturation protein HypF
MPETTPRLEARRATLRGVVQGVGFRPFVVGLARGLGLGGRVCNRGGEVIVEVEGPAGVLDQFAAALVEEAPAAARIEAVVWSAVELREHRDRGRAPSFEIAASEAIAGGVLGDGALAIGPDRRVCADCLAEVFDPSDRRCGYALTGCTDCGPRFAIAVGSPWSRERSSLAEFRPCPACAKEFADPEDRRFHAEAIACPECGPRLRLEDGEGRIVAGPGEAIAAALALLRQGGIVALQGIGGFQLLVDARDQAAVLRLRERKGRPAKPLALMVADLDAADRLAVLDEHERDVLASAAGPIVLVRRRANPGAIGEAVAHARPTLGLMLPTTPAHVLLLAGFGGPLVATSGNVHGRPIAITHAEARAQLGRVADALLVHDRAIQRRCDDSVVQVVADRARVLRLGRGLAPASVELPELAGLPVMLGLGAQLGQAPALLNGGRAWAWPHVGDLDEADTRTAMASSIADLCRMLGTAPARVIVDAHPDYATSLWARAEAPAQGFAVEAVFHHHAHVAAVLAEHGRSQALGFAWDGTGLGPGHQRWGGEVLAVDARGARRVAHLLSYPLPGGDAAARDGLRPLGGLLAAAGLGDAEDLGRQLGEPELTRQLALARNPRLAPPTTSVGRLFDAVAAVTRICRRSRYQAEAAQALEHAASPGAAPYPFAYVGGVLDWRPMLAELLVEHDQPGLVASRFHATLIAMIVAVAQAHAHEHGHTIALAGGCFVNRLLLAGASEALRAAGFEVLAPERLPPGDGGLALGQVWVAGHRLRSSSTRGGSA